MKATLTTLLFLLLPLCAAAQYEWHPIRPGWHYHYTYNGDTGIAAVQFTVWAEQYDDTTDADTVRMVMPLRYRSPILNEIEAITTPFNRKLECWGQGSVWAFNQATGVHINTQVNWVLRPFAQLNESWQITTGLSASVTAVYDSLIWGIPDSVKRITLTNGREIILSQTYGILAMPEYFTGSLPYETVTLAGIQEANAGLHLPERADFFAIQPGTKIWYEVGHGSFEILDLEFPTIIWVNPSIYENTRLPDTVLCLTVDSVVINGAHTYRVYGQGLEGLDSILRSRILLNYENYHFAPYANSHLWGFPSAFPSYGYDTLGNAFSSFGHGYRPVPFLSGSFLSPVHHRNLLLDGSQNYLVSGSFKGYQLTLTQNLGCTHYARYPHNNVTGTGQYQYATAISYELPAAAEEETSEYQPHILVYPNPANNHVRVVCDNIRIRSFQLVNVVGSEASIRFAEMADNEWNADVSTLPVGVYVLRATDASGRTHTHRVVVAR